MDLYEYQLQARVTAIYPSHLKILYPCLGLAGEAGEVCEKVKKLYRDKDGKITEEFKEALTKELGDVLWYLANIASDLNINLNKVALANLEKLLSRSSRNVLQGEGDNR